MQKSLVFLSLSKHLRGAAASFIPTSWLLLLQKAFHRTEETENISQNDHIAGKIKRSSYGTHIDRDIDVDFGPSAKDIGWFRAKTNSFGLQILLCLISLT